MLHALAFALTLLAGPGFQKEDPTILVVTAHPDDEAMFAATIWKTVREYGGAVDLALITDGAGGYRFSTLAEPLYGLNLTDPEVARTSLPAIRKRELMAGGEVVGIRNYFFFDQPDRGKFLKVDSVFTDLWDGDLVRNRLIHILEEGQYDLVLTFLPVPSTHAHHKGAALLALDAVNSLPEGGRPTIVGSMIGIAPGEADFVELDGYPLSRITSDPPMVLDREEPLGLDGRLNYQIVANWLIAEHKSQGTMQTYMSAGRFERFWFYALNSDKAVDRGRELLEAIGLHPSN
jgi:N-acetylglucosamine malate deacetylase 2